MDEATLGELLAFRERNLRTGGKSLCSCFFDTVYGATQPLVAVYEAEALALFREAVEAGRYKLAAVIPAELTACLRYGGEKASFFPECELSGRLGTVAAGTGTAPAASGVAKF